MKPLEKTLRNTLEQTIQDARSVAELGADTELKRLGVSSADAPVYLTTQERALRRALRAHGRQLGDHLDEKTQLQETFRLKEEVAYEHWHRMLFARFLAENGLLIYHDVPVTLDECGELAASQGATNGWELAARLATAMLPQIFRPDSPVFTMVLAPEHQQRLEKLLANLPHDVFTASDALGWVYQFWQSKRKDEVNASEVKIGARELPAVTQLFTEPYMVHFLLDNSLGAWWAGQRLSSDDWKTATSEQELRDKASLPGVPLTYLRLVRDAEGVWSPAAGTFERWPGRLSAFTALDPCCGSGHFVVSLLEMLIPMRMVETGLSAREAVDAVLRENVYGLELDRRCVELAAFNVALAAWRYPGAGGYRALPELHLACCGLAVSAKRDEWLALADGDRNLKLILDELYKEFVNAPTLGSLIDPEAGLVDNPLFAAQWSSIEPLIARVLGTQQNDATREASVVAGGLAKTAQLLTRRYTLITTNPPYLTRGRQDDVLREYSERNFPVSKNDLATVFLQRCLSLCRRNGTVSIVLPQNWLFLTGYRKLREHLLETDTWHLVTWLGPGAFTTIGGEVVKAILLSMSCGMTVAREEIGEAGNTLDGKMRGLDVSALHTATEKDAGLQIGEPKEADQKKQLDNPDARVIFDPTDDQTFLLAEHAQTFQGIGTSDNAQFVYKFWELPAICQGEWRWVQTAAETTGCIGGSSSVLHWEYGKGRYYRHAQALKAEGRMGGWKSGSEAWGRSGFIVNVTHKPYVNRYLGEMFDTTVAAMIVEPRHQAAVYSYITGESYESDVRQIDQALSITEHTLLKVPFDLDHWTDVALEKYPHGLPKLYSDDPTQWVFHGHPCGSVVWDEGTKRTSDGPLRTDDTVLQVAVARLLGYRWPAELDSSMELADEARTWAAKCNALLPYADKDGIVCIPSVRGEPAAADRLLDLLAAAYGKAWNTDVLSQLLAQCASAGKTLETWLRDKFFAQHCKLFQHRPFVWHVWDGLPDGFAALVDYHRLDHKNLETLIYTYLGAWIARQRQDIASGVDGAVERLAAAQRLQKDLEQILAGEDPYDIFVRWKPLSQQPIGWDPDLNDGVRLNIRPFVTAHVLRNDKKPQLNISWDKDRGRDVESAPWCKVFAGDRINVHHTTVREKRDARGLA
jgi:hypothetical protein